MNKKAWYPEWYWTGKRVDDAKLINNPHIKQEGEREDRIVETRELLNEMSGWDSFTWKEACNIQNYLLARNNWCGVKAGIREHTVGFDNAKKPQDIDVSSIFPVSVMLYPTKDELLEWYYRFQLEHPFSDLNGRVGGIIVSVLYDRLNQK